MDRRFFYYFRKYGLLGAALFLFVYFFIHILTGNYGLFSWRSLETELTKNQHILLNLEQEEEKLQNKVKRLKSNHLDQDLLDECARDMLNVGKTGEVMIIEDGS